MNIYSNLYQVYLLSILLLTSGMMYLTGTPPFQHGHFIPIVGVRKGGEYELVHGDLPRQHPFGTTLRFTGPVPADSRQ